MKTIILIAISIFCLQNDVYATYAWEGVNDITKQVKVFRSDKFIYKPIGWRFLDLYDDDYKIKLSEGYKYTDFPYTLDCVLFCFITLSLIVITKGCREGDSP